MDLKEYFQPLSISDRIDFAKRCGVPVKQLANIAFCGRVCSPELAINIERESGGKCRVETLAPRTKKLRVDWKYIRGTARHPRASI